MKRTLICGLLAALCTQVHAAGPAEPPANVQALEIAKICEAALPIAHQLQAAKAKHWPYELGKLVIIQHGIDNPILRRIADGYWRALQDSTADKAHADWVWMNGCIKLATVPLEPLEHPYSWSFHNGSEDPWERWT